MALQEAENHRNKCVNGMLRYELKDRAVLIRNNAVFCLLHETNKKKKNIITESFKKSVLEWTSGHHLAQTSVEVR